MRPVVCLKSIALALAVFTAPSLAIAKPPSKQAKLEAPPARLTSSGKSIGTPTEGHLVGGARLGDAPYVRVVPFYAEGDARWGLESLVGGITRAARAVRKRHPDAVLSVGHLSKPGGGPIDRHSSHESGRDVDVAFYVKDLRGKPVYADHFVPFKGDGTAPSWPGAVLDDARNWAFLAAILTDPKMPVTHVFVSRPIRERMLAYAARVGAPYEVRVKASRAMSQPRGAMIHDDHFHVRVACPVGMRQCVELPSPRVARDKSHGGAASAARSGATASRAKPARPSTRSSEDARDVPVEPAARAESDRPDPRSEDVPILAPIVPGLDSAVLPKRLDVGAP